MPENSNFDFTPNFAKEITAPLKRERKTFRKYVYIIESKHYKSTGLPSFFPSVIFSSSEKNPLNMDLILRALPSH